jgi:hypothetical protein
VSRHVRVSEEQFISAEKVDGLMPMEHEEYDEDPDYCEEDYDMIRGTRRVDDRLDQFLPSTKHTRWTRGNKCGKAQWCGRGTGL